MSEPSTSASSTDPTTATDYTFSLTATNQSSLPGKRYFNVFPPYLLTPSVADQTLTALVSDPTEASAVEPADTTMTWQGGAGTLAMFAVTKDDDPTQAATTSVALGDTVTVSWTDGAFVITPATGGTEGVITVTCTAGIPTGSQIGLTVGPASILIAAPAVGTPLTLTPDLSLSATVVFGTAYQWPKPDVMDATDPLIVTFTPGATGTVSAAIVVGPDDLIVPAT